MNASPSDTPPSDAEGRRYPTPLGGSRAKDIVYAPFDAHKPFDLEAELRRIPAKAIVKGVIMNAVTDQLKTIGQSPTSLRLFSDYRMHDYMRVCVDVANEIWPDEPTREGLRRLGHGHYSAFVNTTIGRMIFGVLGRSMERVLRASPKGYKYSTSSSNCKVISVVDHVGIIELRGLPFADSLQAGVYEGGVRATGFVPNVSVGRTLADYVRLRVAWSAPTDADADDEGEIAEPT